MADKTSTQGQGGQAGTATLEPEHHQTQAATGSPQAGGTAQGSQTPASGTGQAGTGSATSRSTSQGSTGIGSSGSSASPWSPGSSSALSRREPSFPSLGPVGFGSPFSLMRNLADEMDRFFDDFFGYGGGSRGLASTQGLRRGLGQGLWSPQVEVRERDGKLVVCADLPGARKEDVHVEVHDNALILQGERRQENEQNQEGYYRSERSYGRFYRTNPLPEGVNPEQAQATFKDGVLEVTLPLPQEQSPQGHKIEVR